MPQPTKPLVRRSVILDPIHPRDFRELDIIYACEQCSHFAPESGTCTIGYDATKHTRDVQLKNYEMYGRVAFCRFSEID